MYDHERLNLDLMDLDFTDFSEQNFPSFQYIKDYLLQEATRPMRSRERRTTGILIPWPNTHPDHRPHGDHNDSIVWFAYVNDDNSNVMVEQMRFSEALGKRHYPRRDRPDERVQLNPTVRAVARRGIIKDYEEQSFFPHT